jgi:hypothetical protein
MLFLLIADVSSSVDLRHMFGSDPTPCPTGLRSSGADRDAATGVIG